MIRCFPISGSRAADHSFDPVALAKPVMDALATELGLNVKLSVIDSGNALVVAVAEGRGNLTISTTIGRRFPLHAGAASKLLLAYAEPDLRAAVLRGPLDPLTPQTVTDPARLAAELDTIRAEGLAEDRGEYALGINALAVPIFGAGGTCLGALSIPFLTESRGTLGQRIADGLVAAASQIGVLLGNTREWRGSEVR